MQFFLLFEEKHVSKNVPESLTSTYISNLWTCYILCPVDEQIFYMYTYTRVRTLIVATIYLQLIQNGYMFRSFTVLQCSHQHCVKPVASDVEVVGYL